MEPLQRLKLRFPDAAPLGLAPESLEKLLKTLTDADGEPDEVYQSALVQLLDLEIATLLRNPETFTASGEMSITQGLDVRLRALKGERARASLALSSLGGSRGLRAGNDVNYIPLKVFF